MSDDKPLRPPGDPKDDVGDHLEVFFTNGPDGEPIVDTVLRDRSGVGEAVRPARRIAKESESSTQ